MRLTLAWPLPSRREGIVVEHGCAAIIDERDATPVIEAITIEDPGPGEVLVRLAASGVCHSDWWAIENGNWGPVPWPFFLGHEGAGVVHAVGDRVGSVGIGDRVVIAWAVPCGRCRRCARGQPRRCGHELVQPTGVHRDRDGGVLAGVLGCGTLGSHTLVNESQLIPMPDGIPLSRACLLGCGVSTGVGAAIQTASVGVGAYVAVIGLGGIGLSALQGSLIAGADRAIAVDVVPAKLEWASRLGATDVVDASEVDPVEAVRELTDGGVDVAFEAVGRPGCVAQAVEMLAHAGTAVAIGVPPMPSDVTLRWAGSEGAAYANKISLLISDGGDPIPSVDFPEMAQWYLDGRLRLDEMVTREVAFSEENLADAFRAMLAGEVIRTVVILDESAAG
jgi:Zn-dependent alcohol dehydrogenase